MNSTLLYKKAEQFVFFEKKLLREAILGYFLLNIPTKVVNLNF